jgi:D-inositol-3-phosphate glycosyltransferase
MTPKRIAMLSVHTCPLATLGGKETGGMNVYVRDLSRELVRRGVYVDVFTRSQNPHLPHIMHSLGDRGRVIHIPTGPEEPYSKHKILHYLPEFVDNVLAFAQREGITYDVIHSHYWLSGLAARELREAWSREGREAPIVQMFHTLGHIKNQIAAPSEREPQQRTDGETEIVHFADHIVAATPAEVRQLVKYYGADRRKITVIPPGVDTELFHPHSPEDAKSRLGVRPCDRMLLFVGRIEPLKGLDTLLRAMALLANECPTWAHNICVAIIGGDPDTTENEELERLKTIRAELGITDLVVFLGARDQDKLHHYYSAAEMVIMPSHYESFGMVALEAMACGTPVIASDVGGLAHLVRDGETGLHVPNGNPEALAGAIARLVEDHELRERLGQQAHQYAQQYSWECIADRMQALYRKALAPLPVLQLAASEQPMANSAY